MELQMSLRKILPILLILLLPVIASAEISPSLQKIIDNPFHQLRSDDNTIPVWVRFADKGTDLDAALDRAESELTPRAAKRRAKVFTGRLVDYTDLPVIQNYVNAVDGEYRKTSKWLNAASFNMTVEQIHAVNELPFVRTLEPVVRFIRPIIDTVPAEILRSERWDIDYGGSLSEVEQINVPLLHEEGVTGAGILLGMLDSGFKTTHEALSVATVIDRWDFVNDDAVVEDEAGDPSGAHNHGTMTMSTIMGNMPGQLVGPAFGVEVVLAKTEDIADEYQIEEDNWVAGIEWLDSFGVEVVTSSLGYLDWYTFEDLDGNTALCTIAADLAVGRGIVVVNSAGNERGSSFNHIIAPADGDSVIAAGAVSSDGSYSYFSSPGPSYDGRIKPDVAARGSGNHVASPDIDDGYTSASGTSFAGPLTAGVASLVLARMPELTPMQVREAMRMTASQPDSPDNDYGWGILNAYEAAHYWDAKITHTPLVDTENIANDYAVNCEIIAGNGLDPAMLILFWNNGSSWNEVALTSTGGDNFTADIPVQISGTDIAYYLQAGTTDGFISTFPDAGELAPITFHVGPDLNLPQIVHLPIADAPLITWPAVVNASVTDNLGVADVIVQWSHNSVAQADFALVADGDNWSGVFPMDASSVQIGDQFTYSIIATDIATIPNSATDGPHDFIIVDALGIVLVIDDSDTGLRDTKYDDYKQLIDQPVSSRTSASDINTWLNDAGYVATTVSASALTADDFLGNNFVVLSSGDNTSPIALESVRILVQDWVLSGGKLLIEGGETGYDADSTPGYPDFRGIVLHIVDWDADMAGNLTTALGQEDHPILTQPHAVPSTLTFNYQGYGDEDACEPAPDAYIVMETSSNAGDGGIIVYDDNPSPQSAQIVFFTFNLAAINEIDAPRSLVENASAFLMAPEAPPTCSFAGSVSEGSCAVVPLEGAMVTIGNHEILTDVNGEFLIEGLYSGTYTVKASKESYATVIETVTLIDNQTTYLDLVLQEVIIYDYINNDQIEIPDSDPTGIMSIINIGEQSDVSDITVDIDVVHSYQGDLIVELTSPDGTVVRLHNRTGGSTDNILGNYPETLAVGGPGALEDFIGEPMRGDWILFISDNAGADVGFLNSWGLHIETAVNPISDVPENWTGVTSLLPNAPNPFNPKTEIMFDLAKAATAKLVIFDIRGRAVRHLLDGQELPIGRHTVTWSGQDDFGKKVSSGAYFCKLKAGDQSFSRKIMLAK
jgi:subtilisin-like proprotein convertase family protein/subtilisin family serine protease